MKTQVFADSQSFLSALGRQLEKDEARYGLPLGIAKRLCGNLHAFGPDFPWFIAVGNGDWDAIALRTPPYKVILAHIGGDVRKLSIELVRAVAMISRNIPGVVGDKELADGFANDWCKQNRVSVSGIVAMRVHCLTKVKQPPIADGRFRKAAKKDLELVKNWGNRFHNEVFGPASQTPMTDLEPLVDSGDFYFWENPDPVSMAARTRPTGKGITVGWVYTPPQQRGKGYASSCVASLSEELLRSGYAFCTLYTDLANPISNSIYAKIGYEAVCDSADYTFGEQGAAK